MSPMITREQWSARAPKDVTKVPIGARTATCTHHDGAYPVRVTTRAEAIDLAQRDQRLHMDVNGWSDIGYNFLVISSPGNAVDGLIIEGRGRDRLGAHCQDWNTPWIGIQVAVGGEQRPSDKALSSVRALHDACEHGAGRTLAKKGHYQGFNTECPGTFLKAWLKAGMPVNNAIPIRAVVKATNLVKAIVKAPAKAVALATGGLVVDGDFGPATIRALQRWAGTRADGVLGANTWRAVQHRLGITADGAPGPITWRALQTRVGTTPDGAVGANTIRALQRYLNAHSRG